MTIDEAIEHAEERANADDCRPDCRAEHAQLAEWLRELAALRQENEELRELARHAVSLATEHCDEYDPNCDGNCHRDCPWDNVIVEREGKPTLFTCEILHMYDRMSELGIEVDDD